MASRSDRITADSSVHEDDSDDSENEHAIDYSGGGLFGPHIRICSPSGSERMLSRDPNRCILKPSLFGSSMSNIVESAVSSTSKTVRLKPSLLANPLESKGSDPSQLGNETANEVTNGSSSDTSVQSSEAESVSKEETKRDTSDIKFVPLNSRTKIFQEPTPTSAPASTEIALASEASPVTSTTNSSSVFVFGQNLQERVTENSIQENSNGVVSEESQKETDDSRSAAKRKYEEVTIVTGEEDEENILQINCKLFAFDNASSSWIEKGRGTLRVNDKESSEGRSSRLVMRLSGSLRVVLNTKIWSDMTVELASNKSVRLTAIDNDGQVRIYLVMAGKDSDILHRVLTNRIHRKKMKTSDGSSNAGNAEKNLCEN